MDILGNFISLWDLISKLDAVFTPTFNFCNPRVDEAWAETEDAGKINLLVQFQHNGDEQTTIDYTRKIELILNGGTYQSDTISEPSLPAAPSQDYPKRMTFAFPNNAKDWKKAKLIIEGKWTNKRGKEKSKKWKMHIKRDR